jgi:trans-aconitate methyltransferase
MEDKYYHTKESVEEYIRLAKDVNGKNLIDKLKEHIPLESQLLELGSGPGTDWEILSKDFVVTGSDYSEEFLGHLRTKHPNAQFLHLDASTLETSQKFDAIYSNKVLHHLTDQQLKQSIQRQRNILNANGIICHSFWAGEGDEIFKGMFVNYHTKQALDKLFSTDFQILEMESYAEFETDDSILLIAKMK